MYLAAVEVLLSHRQAKAAIGEGAADIGAVPLANRHVAVTIPTAIAAIPYHAVYVKVRIRLITKTEKERWVREYGRGIPDHHGDVRWIDGVILDIEEEK